MEIDSESLFTRFGKNAETIRVTGKLKNLKGKVGVVTIRNLEESWDVKIPKGFLRWEIPEKLFKFIDLTGKVVWDSVTDERPVAEDGDLEAFTKIPLAKNVTKESFLKSANDIKSIAKDGKNKGRTTAIAAHLSNLYPYNSLRKLADVHFCETVEVKKGLNKKLLAKGMAQQIVDGDIKWKDVVRNETDLIPDDDSDLEESEREEEEEGDRAASNKRRKLKHDGKKSKKEEIDAELEEALAEQKRLQLILADGRKIGAGGKSVTFNVNNELAKQVQEANAILRQRLEDTATNNGLSCNALLAAIGLENTSSGEDRAKLFREFQGRGGTESVKHEVLKKFKKDEELVLLRSDKNVPSCPQREVYCAFLAASRVAAVLDFRKIHLVTDCKAAAGFVNSCYSAQPRVQRLLEVWATKLAGRHCADGFSRSTRAHRCCGLLGPCAGRSSAKLVARDEPVRAFFNASAAATEVPWPTPQSN
eukprot:g13942.t1